MTTLGPTAEPQRDPMIVAQAHAILAAKPRMSKGVERLLTDWGNRVQAVAITGDRELAGATALDGVRAIIGGMAGDQPYVVRAGNSGGNVGSTDYNGRIVTTTTAPLDDPRLTWPERFGVMVAIAMHEAGHARGTEEHARMLERYLRPSAKYVERPSLRRLGNIASDVSLEGEHVKVWPGYAGVFDLAMWWVATRSGKVASVEHAPRTQAEALNLAGAVARYEAVTCWGDDPALDAERDWWRAWAAGCVGLKPRTHLAHLREALDHISALPIRLPQEPQPPVTDGPKGDEPEPGEGDDDGDDVVQDTDDDGNPTEGEDQPGKGGGSDPEGDPDDDGDSDEGEPGEGTATGDESEDTDEGEGAGSADEGADEDPDGGEPGEGEAEGDGDESATDGEGGPGDENATDGDSGERASEDGSADPSEAQDQVVGDDALAKALPDHPSDVLTDEERDADRAANVRSGATNVAHDQVTVDHGMGLGSRKTVAIRGVAHEGQSGVKVDPSAATALRQALADQRKQADQRMLVGRRGSRISAKHVARVASGRSDVFVSRDLPGPARLDVHLLVDRSTSMGNGYGSRLNLALNMAANLTAAVASRGDGRSKVWAFSSGEVLDIYDSRRAMDRPERLSAVGSRGITDEATAVAAVAAKIATERSSSEASVLVVLADGQPSGDEIKWLPGAVAEARRNGIAVMSVALADGITSSQHAGYGADATVVWTGDWARLSRDMAAAIGKATSR